MYCPNCITKLVRNKKKLGDYSVWFICPTCGLRVRPDVSFELPKDIFEIEKDRINNNNEFHENN